MGKKYINIRIDEETYLMLKKLKKEFERKRKRAGVKVRITYPKLIKYALEKLDGNVITSLDLKAEINRLIREMNTLIKNMKKNEGQDVWF